ncbi:MAG: energy-coupling factor transporter transmembrane component T [Chloroflexi bacterium]|nr:energy-coupling factor transporter transmembrane component T [Chloroflexota bacterium]
MSAEFDLYVRRDTWLHRLDPRVKLVFVIEATILTFLWPSIWSAAAAIVLCSLLVWRGQIPAAQIGRVWRVMAPLMVMVFVLNALFGGGGEAVWFRLGPLTITAEAVQRGALLAMRLLALTLIVSLWLFTTDQASLVRGFVALRLPYAWGLTLALALRYLPIFAGLFEQVRDAQQARGLDLEGGGFWRKLNAYRPVLIAMLISALRNSERLGWALEARAVGAAGIRRTTFRALHMRRTDTLVLAGLLIVFAAGLLLRVL